MRSRRREERRRNEEGMKKGVVGWEVWKDKEEGSRMGVGRDKEEEVGWEVGRDKKGGSKMEGG